MNCYRAQIERTLPRILAMYDIDRTSESYGCGDRFYWGWKLIDYPNGTFQALASGLAGLFVHGLLPEYLTKKSALDLIDAIFLATEKQLSAKGSLDEAFPNEASFCVTGLVAGDLLLAIDRLGNTIDEATRLRWLSIIKPMIDFLGVQDEYHGLISNHLATNALALVRWADLSGEEVDGRAQEWVERILNNQSDEGWFREYNGPDPGYQTWCTSSLSAIHALRPDWGLLKALKLSFDFLALAAHPDGSFGGIYGSRMTRFIFPAGLEQLSCDIPKAASMAKFARESIEGFFCVTLETIDPSNCIPVFNDYVTALIALENTSVGHQDSAEPLPFEGEDFRQVYTDAGWLVQKTQNAYTILNLFSGGAGVHIHTQGGHQQISGYVGKNSSEVMFSSQLYDDSASWDIQDDVLTLKSNLYQVKRPKPDALRFIVLRVLCVTAFRSLYIGNIVKKLLVKMLVTGKSKVHGSVKREIKLVDVIETTDYAPPSLVNISDPSFKPVHMASMGYWQRCDTGKNKGNN